MSISQKAIVLRGEPKPQVSKPDKVCKECGQRLPTPRYRARHDLLFAVLKPAHAHWPETAPWQSTDLEDFRARLLIEVGWCTAEDLHFSGTSPKQIMAAFAAFTSLPRKKPFKKFEELPNGGFRCYAAKSIAWTRECPEEKFKIILTDVIDFVENVIGVPVADLKREHENEA